MNSMPSIKMSVELLREHWNWLHDDSSGVAPLKVQSRQHQSIGALKYGDAFVWIQMEKKENCRF